MIGSYKDVVHYTLDYKFDPKAPSHFKVEMNIKGVDNRQVLQSYFESVVEEIEH